MRFLGAFLVLVALALAGSEGAGFPWVNLAGVAIFFGLTALAGCSGGRNSHEESQAG